MMPRLPIATLLIALLAGMPALASHRVMLTGAGDERGLDTFRAVSKVAKKTGAVFVERTQDGLKVGQLAASATDLSRDDLVHGRASNIDAEERIAVVRPVFEESTAAVRGYKVISVQQKTFTVNTSVFRVLESWSAGTAPQQIFEIQHDPSAITPTELIAVFQRVLDAGNKSSATNGLYLQGTANLRIPSTQPLLFDVLVEAPLGQGRTIDSTSVHALIPVTATAEIRNVVIGTSGNGAPVTQRFNFLAFSATFPGQATIFVQDTGGTLRSIATNIPVAAGITYRTAIRNEALRAGANQVLVQVADTTDPTIPADQIPRGFSAPLTMNNPP